MKRTIAAVLTLLTVLAFAACAAAPTGQTEDPSGGVSAVPGDPTSEGSASASDPSSERDEYEFTFYASSGLISYADGYTYFVVPGENNDGSDNGTCYSDDIYRIADDAAAKAQFVASVPRVLFDDIAQVTACYLAACGDQVYYLHERSGLSGFVISRADASTGKTEDLLEVRDGWRLSRNGVYKTKDALYLSVYRITETDGGTPFEVSWKKVDLASGAVTDFELPADVAQADNVSLTAISGGYIYFAKYGKDGDTPYGIYRTPIGGGGTDEVCPVPVGAENVKIYANTVWFSTEDGFVTYDVDTGKKCGSIPETIFDRSFSAGKIFNIAGDTLYYLKSDGLYCVNRDGSDQKQLIEGDLAARSDDILFLGVTGSHFYLLDDDYMTCRFKKDARIISFEPLAEPISGSDDLKVYNGEWEYYDYPNCVIVHAYVGDKENVTVPQTIDGKKVVRVYLSWDKRENGIKTLTVPEGVKSLGTLYGKNIEKVDLPRSLVLMTSRGYPYVFETKDGATIVYAGTKAEWQTLCDNCDKYVGIDHSGAKDLTVQCSDGVWKAE